MSDFQFVKGSEDTSRNSIPLRAKVRALQIVQQEGKQAKEALATVASEFNLDGAKNSWTKFAGSTLNRFRSEIKAKLAQEDNAEIVSLLSEFGVEVNAEEPTSLPSPEEG